MYSNFIFITILQYLMALWYTGLSDCEKWGLSQVYLKTDWKNFVC